MSISKTDLCLRDAITLMLVISAARIGRLIGTVANDLNGLRRAASDASDPAEHLKSADDELESKKDDLQSAVSSLRLCSSDWSVMFNESFRPAPAAPQGVP